ncbi:MAG: hypothetical protein ABIR17_11975 [Pseudolysinimonas sp.]|uniref:hypothetical protein n=1 Tax=Pseudolysinimonas sp. TaxID=2680009 RepID=UPI0032642DF4
MLALENVVDRRDVELATRIDEKAIVPVVHAVDSPLNCNSLELHFLLEPLIILEARVLVACDQDPLD